MRVVCTRENFFAAAGEEGVLLRPYQGADDYDWCAKFDGRDCVFYESELRTVLPDPDALVQVRRVDLRQLRSAAESEVQRLRKSTLFSSALGLQEALDETEDAAQ